MSISAYEAQEKKYGNLKQAIKLPVNPLGGFTDSQYLADNAMLRHSISRQYADLLQQLGYTDGKGHFIMGDVESGANRQRSDLIRSVGLAEEDTTHQMQNASTLFSGYRGTAQARAEHPFVQGIADLDVSVPKQLAKLFEQASGLVEDYTLQDQQLLAAAASRAAGAITDNPVYTPPPAVDTTTPTATATPGPDFGPRPAAVAPVDAGNVFQPGSTMTPGPKPIPGAAANTVRTAAPKNPYSDVALT